MQFWIRKWHFEFVVYLFVNWKCSASKPCTTANCTIYYFPTLNGNVVTQLLLCLCSDSDSIRIERISFLIYLFSANAMLTRWLCLLRAVTSGGGANANAKPTQFIFIILFAHARRCQPKIIEISFLASDCKWTNEWFECGLSGRNESINRCGRSHGHTNSQNENDNKSNNNEKTISNFVINRV